MTGIDLACGRYRDIRPEKWSSTTARFLTVWLRDDVCGAVEEYWRRPSFQEQATWSLRALGMGAETPERGAVDKVSGLLVEAARHLCDASRLTGVAKKLREQNPPGSIVSQEAVWLSGNGAQVLARETQDCDFLAIEQAQVQQIARPFWSDLVSAEDYFAPTAGWLNRSPGQAGEFVVSLNPELHRVGDFVTRCMLRRVAVLFDILKAFRRKCFAAAPSRRPKSLERLHGIWPALQKVVNGLASFLHGQAGQLRDSCVILTQAYAAFRPEAETDWLGLPDSIVTEGRGRMVQRFREPALETFDRVAAAIEKLGRLYQGRTDERPVEEAVATGGLVLTGQPAAFWKCKKIEVEWGKFPRLWQMLVELARKAKRQGHVTERDLFDDANSSGALAQLKGRLSGQLPATLRGKIVPGPEARTYSLAIDPKHIHLFLDPTSTP